ncbi:MAG: pyrimidine dimer DNA glycosylase/endonuclease V [Candidatus Dojkabacteria bacterium]|nr:pyrimidine dimer DNA glycosylase/endonuclease V [Candidatus Dojkabacteria bacterium]
MNIFRLDNCPQKAAQYQNNKHIVKMPLETAQLLCTALHMKKIHEPWMYKPFNPKHPSAIWTRESKANFLWLCHHGIALCEEYTYRYRKTHKSFEIIQKCKNYASLFSDIDETPLLLAMPKKFHTSDAVHSYRLYYAGEKTHLAQWFPRPIPDWWETYLQLVQKINN